MNPEYINKGQSYPVYLLYIEECVCRNVQSSNTRRCPVWSSMLGRMIKNQEQDEFIAVRVQDPRVQNEGFWNSYVDFKIFLHTNSMAFTAKTSCVRRRYSEFVWLKKKLQKNAGLVPIPELPSKTPFFSFNNEDFLERRRKGLQRFLDKVLNMTVCLSDSQLHLFLQTQLPLSHIEDCVQGLTPYTVTEAILSYASSNRGWAQEEQGSAFGHSILPILYESVDSPSPCIAAPHCVNGEAVVHQEEASDADACDERDTSMTNSHTGDSSSTNSFMTCEADPQEVPASSVINDDFIVFVAREAGTAVEHGEKDGAGGPLLPPAGDAKVCLEDNAHRCEVDAGEVHGQQQETY
ncbi:sorting nexin-11 [Arapaima gigas]